MICLVDIRHAWSVACWKRNFHAVAFIDCELKLITFNVAACKLAFSVALEQI